MRIVGWFLPAHIGLPMFFGIAFIIFSAAVMLSVDGWEVLVETAQDLTILSLGATGAIFDNPRVELAFGSNSALVAIAVIAVNLIVSAVVVFIRARATRRAAPVSFAGGIITLFVAALTLGVPVLVIVWAYTHGS